MCFFNHLEPGFLVQTQEILEFRPVQQKLGRRDDIISFHGHDTNDPFQMKEIGIFLMLCSLEINKNDNSLVLSIVVRFF